MAEIGTEEAEEIIRRFSDMIYRIAVHNVGSRADAEDITQDVFIELITKCPEHASEERLKAWLIRVTVNKCSSFHRLAWQRRRKSLDDCARLEAPEHSGVMEEVRRLPKSYRIVIYLYYYENYKIAEIAEILGKNPNTVSSALQRARKKLKHILPKERITMRNNRYTEAVSQITASAELKEKMLNTAKYFEKKEKVIDMKKRIKCAVAASLAVAVTAGAVIGFNLSGGDGENTFAIKVGAAEISRDRSVVMNSGDSPGFNLSESNDSIAAFWVDLPMEFEGENIETVTYSVDSGALMVTARKDLDPVIDGEKLSREIYTPYSVAYTKEDVKALNALADKETEEKSDPGQDKKENEIYSKYTRDLYSSFTVAYNNQHPDGSAIGFVGSAEELDNESRAYLEKNKETLYNIYGKTELLDAQKKCLEKLIGRTVHCAVKFRDGSERTMDIRIGAAVSEYSKARPEEYSKLPDGVKEAKDYTGVFATYSIAG